MGAGVGYVSIVGGCNLLLVVVCLQVILYGLYGGICAHAENVMECCYLTAVFADPECWDVGWWCGGWC